MTALKELFFWMCFFLAIGFNVETVTYKNLKFQGKTFLVVCPKQKELHVYKTMDMDLTINRNKLSFIKTKV
jgi:hypothetical protein